MDWYDIVEAEKYTRTQSPPPAAATGAPEREVEKKIPKKRKKNIRGWYVYQFKQKCAVRKIENWYILMNLLN